MILFFAFFLCFVWLVVVVFKMQLPTKLYNKFPCKFIDELTNCHFCMESHISTIMAFCLFGACTITGSDLMQEFSVFYRYLGNYCAFLLSPMATGLHYLLKGLK